MEGGAGAEDVGATYEAKLEQTLQALNNRKRELEDALRQMRASAGSSGAGLSAKDSLAIMTGAYKIMTEQGPYMPPPGSPLPALLAMRRARQTITETNEHIDAQRDVLEQLRQRVEAEEANFREQQALQTALENRIQSLRGGLESREKKSEEQIAEERMAELRKEKEYWDEQTSHLMKELNWFISEHLGPMLAAEELGGPVVGGLMDIDPEDLSAGFSAQGKLKKSKERPDQDRRQRRIDDIWGPREEQGRAGTNRNHEGDEAAAASAEMRDLMEQLMNKLVEAGGDTSAVYVELPRESAAARFLVRSKVALFHPRDARKLRLVDFGRDLED
ncbi:hypothetical protein VTH06DRAFT_8005 [Thermothelomyces fergusii]